MANILVFGDSITYGVWDLEGGWVARLRKFLDKRAEQKPNLYCQLYNLGVPGNTTDDLLDRFEFELGSRIDQEEETIFIFAIGINDSQFIQSLACHKVAERKFKENLQNLIGNGLKKSHKIIFVGLTPVDENKTTPIPWNKDKYYKNEYIKNYNEKIRLACERNKINFIEVFDTWIKLDYQNLLDDGLHPNSEGHKLIYEEVKNYLLNNHIIEL